MQRICVASSTERVFIQCTRIEPNILAKYSVNAPILRSQSVAEVHCNSRYDQCQEMRLD